MREIGQLLTPMVTPFGAGGELDLETAAAYAKWLVKTRRADSLIVSGTTGEFQSLTFDERIALIEAVYEAAGKRTPVIAGTGCASTRETIALTKEAERIGVDMAMIVAPYYAKYDQAGILEHYRAVAKSTKLPLMVYNIPLFTGVNVEPDTLSKLSKLKNVVAVKEESGINPLQTTRYLMSVPDSFRLYVGDDTMVLPILAQGGAGAVSGGAQICGADLRRLIKAVIKGKYSEAQNLHRKTFPLFEAFYQNGRVNPIPILRAGIKLAGFDTGQPRGPMHPATPAEVRVLRKVMKDAGYLATK